MASQSASSALLAPSGCAPGDSSRRMAAQAQTEFGAAVSRVEREAATKTALAGRRANRITVSNFEQANEVYIGLCATAVFALVIWTVCLPAFDMSTVPWLRSSEVFGSAYNVSGILHPYRQKVWDKHTTAAAAFEAMDADDNNFLDLSEFTDGSKRFDGDLDEFNWERLFRHMDVDKDDQLDIVQFISAVDGRVVRKLANNIAPGSTKIDVDNEAAIHIGDVIMLQNDHGDEEVTVVGKGSLMVEPKIKNTYHPGDTVEVVHCATRTTTTVTTTTKTTRTVTTTTAKKAKSRLLALMGPLFT